MTTEAEAQDAGGGPAGVQRIAAAVDASPEGRDAIVLAQALAGAGDPDLLLIGIEPDLSFALPYADWQPMRKETVAKLSRLRDELAPKAFVAADRDTSIARGIERLARRNRRDLLVVGSGHRGADAEVSIGHTARQLISDLSYPFAIAPRGLAGRPGFAVRRIGVGYDDGPQAREALTVARGLAEQLGAELIVRGVIDDRMPALGWAPGAAAALAADWDAAIDQQAAELEQAIRSAVAGARGQISAQVTRGTAATELLGLSGEVDLIVIGSRRWGVVARLLLGGTGEALGRGSRAPLMVVPAVGEQ